MRYGGDREKFRRVIISADVFAPRVGGETQSVSDTLKIIVHNATECDNVFSG